MSQESCYLCIVRCSAPSICLVLITKHIADKSGGIFYGQQWGVGGEQTEIACVRKNKNEIKLRWV